KNAITSLARYDYSGRRWSGICGSQLHDQTGRHNLNHAAGPGRVGSGRSSRGRGTMAIEVNCRYSEERTLSRLVPEMLECGRHAKIPAAHKLNYRLQIIFLLSSDTDL